MHIPDGYLNLPTCAATFGVMAPVWATAAKKLKHSFEAKQVPLVALGAAFSFVLMMFNFPLVGGSSGHAVGGAILAILLGPWAAVSVLSVVVAIQAILFHDGGLTTFAANAFSMAFVLPFCAYAIYRLILGSKTTLFWKGLAAALSGYLGLAFSAFVTAILLGIQPHGPSGYAPYPLSVTVSVMVGGHLLVFGWVEGLVTAFVLIWVTKNFPSGASRVEPVQGGLKKAWVFLFILILLSPLGLLASGTAFGEWSGQELKKLLGYVPFGIRHFSNTWSSPLAGYRISGHSILYGYLASAVIGALAAGVFGVILLKVFLRETITTASPSDSTPVPARQDRLPDWMLHSEPSSFRQRRSGQSSLLLDPRLRGDDKQGHIYESHQTRSHLNSFFLQTIFLERFQKLDGFLQRRDPRIKLLALLLFVFLSTWIKSWPLLLILLGAACAFCVFSKIPLTWYGRYVLGTMALFSLVITLPAATAWISPGRPWLTLYSPYLAITHEGAKSVGLFILRATTAIAWGALLPLSTTQTRLLKALGVLRIPQIFLFMVEISYRYIFLFVRLLEQMSFAREARTISALSTRGEQRWATGRIAFLLQRSFELSDQVYSAMLARGYHGKIRSMDRFKFDAWDKAFGFSAALLSALLILINVKGITR